MSSPTSIGNHRISLFSQSFQDGLSGLQGDFSLPRQTPHHHSDPFFLERLILHLLTPKLHSPYSAICIPCLPASPEPIGTGQAGEIPAYRQAGALWFTHHLHLPFEGDALSLHRSSFQPTPLNGSPLRPWLFLD